MTCSVIQRDKRSYTPARRDCSSPVTAITYHLRRTTRANHKSLTPVQVAETRSARRLNVGGREIARSGMRVRSTYLARFSRTPSAEYRRSARFHGPASRARRARDVPGSETRLNRCVANLNGGSHLRSSATAGASCSFAQFEVSRGYAYRPRLSRCCGTPAVRNHNLFGYGSPENTTRRCLCSDPPGR